VGEQTRATVRHCEDGGSAVHVQTGPQETPPAKTDSKDNSRKRVHINQRTGYTLAGRLDGDTSDF